VVTEYDGSGNVKNAYIHNLAIDDPLAVEQGGNIYFYHKDGLGSVMDLTNISGSVVKSYRHKSFGEIYSETGTIDQPYTFTAREYDPESGLYYYRARYYDPKAGRFLTKDPIRFAGRDVNLYRYVANDPLNRIDPHGLLNPKGQWPLYKKEDYEQGVKELSYRIREKDPSISQERATEMANDILKEMTVPEALKVEKLLKANDIEAIEKLLKDIYDRAQQKKKACP
jgi:RHS repeat-associated protein